MSSSTLKKLTASSLMVDEAVQRGLDWIRVQTMAADLNLEAVGVLTVSERANGDRHILDGQTRAAALMLAEHGTTPVDCRVFTGLTVPQEAALFRQLNNTKSLTKLDLFRIRVVEGEPVAVAITALLDEHGWRVGKAPGWLSAIATFEQLFTQSPAAAALTIATITKAWGHDSDAVVGSILQGIGGVYLRYETHVNTGELVERLTRSSGGPGGLIGKARGLSSMLGVPLSRAVAEIVVELYNARRKSRQLPAWRSA